MLTALVGEEARIGQLVIVEAEGGAEAAAALHEVSSERYQPFLVEIPVTPAHARDVGVAVPLLASMRPVDGQSAAYLCANFTCQAPVTTVDALRAALAQRQDRT